MLDFVIQVAKKSGYFLRENFGKELRVEHKGRIDLVTLVDKRSQDIIVSEIEKRFPDHSIVAEEGIRKNKAKNYIWYIDPLDGTVNYVHNIPIFCVSIALYRDNEPYIGVCYNPMNNELFCAQSGSGAFLNKEKITVSETQRLVDALLVTGFPYETNDMDTLIERFSRCIKNAQGIRRLGSAAIDLCYVASGRFDGFWESGLNPWDLAAGIVILEEAGGTVTSFDGSLFDLSQGEILASNTRIHNDFKKLM